MTIIVPAVLGGLALTVMALVSIAAARKNRQAAQQLNPSQPRILIHSINHDRCTGCDACVAVCPTNVLDLVNNKSHVLRFQDCIQCEACMWACPTTALVMHLEGTEPPSIKMPELDENFQTAVPGQYLIGEVAGKPLVKNAANLGRVVIEHMLRSGLQTWGKNDPNRVDVAIVGSGPGGLSAALTCIHRGLSYVVLEKEQLVASTISRYPKGKFVMAEPYDVRNLSLLPVYDSSKEQLVAAWEDLIRRTNLVIKQGEAVEEITKKPDGTFEVRTTVATYMAQRTVLATGTRGKPRTLGVPGENLPKVNFLLEDPDDFRGKPVIVTGGGDSAVEAAMALADAGAKVVLSYRGRSFNRCAPKNRQAIESYDAQRRVKVRYQSNIIEFTSDKVTLEMTDGSKKVYPNEAAFVLIGADPPIKWLQKVGVNFVERPHTYALGKTDDLVTRFLGNDVALCPEDAASTAELVLYGRTSGQPQYSDPQQQHQPQAEPEVSGARKWLRNATAMFNINIGRKVDEPMSLNDFAQQRRHSGSGRRDALPKAERTRILRMLRDDGARLADEDSRVDIAPVPAAYGAYESGPSGYGDQRSHQSAAPHQATVMLNASPNTFQRQQPSYQQSGYQQQGYQQSGYQQPGRSGGQYGFEDNSDDATRAVDMSALAKQDMRAFARGQQHFPSHEEATRVAGEPSFGAFEEPTRAVDMDQAFGRGGGQGYSPYDEATRAVDVKELARIDPRLAGGGSSFDDEATRAVDMDAYPEARGDVEWDLD